ncbi:MAG: LPS-assembly protein LptD, partial [Muribaculaceae bacterium]|nr:LPS-assembly protein LptD [Muribaculaceae bacterium]
MRRFFVYISALALSIWCVAAFGGERIVADDGVASPTVLPADSVADTVADTVVEVPAIVAPDSVGADSALVVPAAPVGRASRISYVRTDLDAAVNFSSSDSMLIVRRDSAYMFGSASVAYGDIKLDAAEIQMDLSDNTVYAVGRVDSLGEMQGKPVFSEGGTDYEARTMRYNFATEKGYISNVVTQQGEGYLTGGTTKKDVENEFYIKDGFYTTCDHHDDPHFGFRMTKAKVRPGKNIVVG